MGMNDKSYDAAFNLARVWFILASQFYLPPNTLDCYSSSIQMYQKALNMTDHPNRKNEAAFNLAQTMNATADALEEYQAGNDESSAREQGKELREGAAWLLNPVLQSQLTWVKGLEALEEQKKEKGDMEVDGDDDKDKEDEDMPTRDALVDSLLLQMEIGMALWTYGDQTAPPSDEQQEAIRGFANVAGMFGPPNRQPEIDLAECKVLLAVDGAMYDIVKDQVQPGSGVEGNIAMAGKAVETVLKSIDSLPAGAEDPSVRADSLVTLAEAEMSHAARLHYFFHKGTANPEMATTAWSQLSAAATHLSAAAKLPVTAHTPREFRPSLYLSLLNATLSRARLAPFNETAASNIHKLLDNCAAYASKAAEAVGWKFALLPRENDPQPNPFFVEPLTVPFPAGWDMEMLARDTQLAMLRVCYFAKSGVFGDKIDADFYSAAATAVLDGITSVSAGPRRLMPSDVKRYVSDVEDFEGKISEGEVEWWKDVDERVQRHLPREGDEGLPI